MKRLIMISINGCPICDKLRPISQEVANDNGLQFAEFNTEDKESYNYDINGIPTFIHEEDGKILHEGTGENALRASGLYDKWR